jgi:hypothetical protein
MFDILEKCFINIKDTKYINKGRPFRVVVHVKVG